MKNVNLNIVLAIGVADLLHKIGYEAREHVAAPDYVLITKTFIYVQSIKQGKKRFLPLFRSSLLTFFSVLARA